MTTSLPTCDLITSVPLHRSRQRQRGYNQAAEIAKSLAKLLSIPYQELLIRTKATQAQTSTRSKTERAQNLSGAFSLAHPASNLKNCKVLIVDDVYTTGATLAACAGALATAQPQEIHAATLAIKQ